MGMGKSKLDERKCERLVRYKRLDLKLLNKGLPEEMRTGEVLYLGNVLEVHTSSKKVWIAERLLVLRYLTVLGEDWEGIRSSEEGVYAPEHPDFRYFQSRSALILARLEFLKQTLMYLIVEEDLSWHVVWMYMMLFVEQYFMGVQFETRSRLDGEMLEAWCERENRVVRFHALVKVSVKLVEKAHSLAREFSGSMKATGSRWRRAVQERRAVRRGERRSVRRAGAGEVQEKAVSSAAGEGEDPGRGSILSNH